MRPNEYSRWAVLYDHDPRQLYADDLPFYLQRAKKQNGSVLELACGTGRIAIPLAKAGFHVTGLDHSRAMLDVFQRKIESLDPDTRKRITLAHVDMASFALRDKFPLILIPFRSFQALVTPEARAHCLAKVKQHLTAQGEFILDVFQPQGVLDASWVQPRQKDWEYHDVATDRIITRYSTRKAIDPRSQVMDIDMTFVISKGAAIIEQFTEPLKLAYFYKEQLVDCVQQMGFIVTEAYGYYDHREVTAGGEIILVCKHAGQSP